MADNLLEKIRTSSNLPSLSAVALEVLRLSRQEDTSIDDLVDVMAKDPALASKMLKTVNSSLFGLSREIGSLKQAAGLLGLRSVKLIALSFSLIEAMQGQKDGFDYNTYWKRSLSSAVAARLMAKQLIPKQAEEAFVAGLLADVGMVCLWRCVPELYQPVLEAWNTGTCQLEGIEMEQLGISHARIGQELLMQWNLPDILCQAVGAHHGEGLGGMSGDKREMAQVVMAATSIAGLFAGDFPTLELDAIKVQCSQMTRIHSIALEEIMLTLDEHVRTAAAMLSVPIGDTQDYAQIQAEAAMQMAELSLEAEMERIGASQRESQARSQVEELHEEKRAFLKAASTDGLTQIANRHAFDKRLREEFRRAGALGYPIGLIMLDLDYFKLCNDIYGHQAGDEVLRQVACSMEEVVQRAGYVARYGGEEFAVIVVQKAAQEIRELAEEIRQTIAARPVKFDDEELRITASLGVACISPASSPTVPEELIKDADQQLYRAKRGGRNRVQM